MSALNWRCCAKGLRELKETTKILMRDKKDHDYIEIAEYDPENETLMSDLDNPVARHWVNPNDYKLYEFVTLGEL